MSDFDKHFGPHVAERFREHKEMMRRARNVVLAWSAFTAILSLGILGALCYVAWHFISKVW